MEYQSARTEDLNGFIEVRGNPISKAGVFPYLGREIGAPEPDRIYRVYRPAEELMNPATISSFKLVPLVDEHAMLGSEQAGMTPAERKGVMGVVGEDIYFDPPYLRANLKIFGESAKRLVKTGEKIELSPGYRCRYEFTPGVFDGEQYDAIQRELLGNHLALVTEGRTGPDVAVLDHARFALDANSLKEAVMADENKQAGDSLEEAKKLLAALSDDERKMLLAEFAGGEEEVKVEEKVEEKVVDQDPEAIAAAEEAVMAAEAAAEAVIAAVEEVKEAAEEVKVATDSAAALQKLHAAQKKLAKAKGAPVTIAQDRKPAAPTGMDAATMVAMIADRDDLAKRLSGFVGAFDSARMTSEQVAKYGVEKLGIPCAQGFERIALDAWMHGRQPEHKKPTFAADHSGKSVNILEKWGK
ncbi:MAG TPA: DUF2213 domain-containing protein [Devosia sp.]|nr:DUF2213 domain-containing protein [Devosia sp.]